MKQSIAMKYTLQMKTRQNKIMVASTRARYRLTHQPSIRTCRALCRVGRWRRRHALVEHRCYSKDWFPHNTAISLFQKAQTCVVLSTHSKQRRQWSESKIEKKKNEFKSLLHDDAPLDPTILHLYCRTRKPKQTIEFVRCCFVAEQHVLFFLKKKKKNILQIKPHFEPIR